MAWDDGLLEQQRAAACHIGSHARLLAGPGTGKTRTLTQHICFLIEEKGISPDTIRAISFTRATAGDLHQRIRRVLHEDQIPIVSTLHSFALSELLNNNVNVRDIIFPLRIADDWEENHIIFDDIKGFLGMKKSGIIDLFQLLSANWESLDVEKEDWEEQLHSRNPQFIGAWQEHRRIYGYTLRSEIVYQLKKAIEQSGGITTREEIKYLIVDEYQDLNKCDMSIINYLAQAGVELYVAGDDDQSIYGFRKAHPDGIRRFTIDYEGGKEYELGICMRCAKKVLHLGLFVVEQDRDRIEKHLESAQHCEEGTVKILRFFNQLEEASSVAILCQYLIKNKGLQPSDILILLRSDKYNVFSAPILNELHKLTVPAIKLEDQKLRNYSVRAILCFLRLHILPKDSLSWRTLLSEWCDNIGPKSIEAIYNMAKEDGCSFADAIYKAIEDKSRIPSNIRSVLLEQISRIIEINNKINSDVFEFDLELRLQSTIRLIEYVRIAAVNLNFDDELLGNTIDVFQSIIDKKEPKSLDDLIRYITSDISDSEEIRDADSVNILTMHKAKGLEAKAVFIVAAEDEYIPRMEGELNLSEDRRLLYVSLTRSKEYLYITYCNYRTGRQKHTGRANNESRRTLTRFLQDSPFSPESGKDYTKKLGLNIDS